MVKAVKGTLIETDPSVKEIIQMFTAEENVVIEDINDRMLFIDTAYKEAITEKVEKILQNYIKKNE
ncbi:TFIIH basal transcription factor complex TTD-A subunit [Tubulinosema ratisbonensis]|uniref:General transcription and DNA repair factor IIH subunit TFB5 n=1 Tax=Tubulinosema ratisbonensis TaxID=291195 RepID=A0A437APG7_9MICR|nr:TFIIH basal transcription factor complex TTD-A subunit [Tubulinosema ratisbonensis]